MDLITASLISAGGSFLGGMFGDDAEEPDIPVLDPQGRQVQAEAYRHITQALSGQGMYPGLYAQQRKGMLDALTKEYIQSRSGLSGALDRIVSQDDTKVRTQAYKELDQDYARTVRDIGEMDIERNFLDKQSAIGTGLSALAQERRVATSVGQINMESQMNQMQSPTFATELLKGLGSASAYFAAKMGGIK